MRVFRSNFLTPDVLSGVAVLQRCPGLDLQDQGGDTGHEDQDGAYRHTEGP